MNRRSFLKNSALALFGFIVLPPAETYERIWKVQRKPIVNPAYFNPADYQGEWKMITYTPVEDPLPPFKIGPPVRYWFNMVTGDTEKVVDASLFKA
jgi:hypothetical protein